MNDQDVQNAVGVFFTAVDECDWPRLVAGMSTPIHVDYESFGAGPPTDLEPEALVAGWMELLPGFDHTHHQLGNLQVQVGGTAARVQAYVTATHTLGAAIWTVVGRYDIGLTHSEEGWQLSRLRLHYKYQDGARELPERARERVRAGEGRPSSRSSE
ncbi:MAG: nuclear transport factor 2 family protein [Myxococcota bacterium]